MENGEAIEYFEERRQHNNELKAQLDPEKDKAGVCALDKSVSACTLAIDALKNTSDITRFTSSEKVRGKHRVPICSGCSKRTTVGTCPSCGNRMVRYDFHFCPYCGQLLEWGDNDVVK